jgi:hypothetical protein
MDNIDRELYETLLDFGKFVKKLVGTAKQKKKAFVSYMLIYFLTLSSRKLVCFLLEVLMHLQQLTVSWFLVTAGMYLQVNKYVLNKSYNLTNII